MMRAAREVSMRRRAGCYREARGRARLGNGLRVGIADENPPSFLLGVIAAPDPDEGVGQRLIEDLAVAVPGRLAEDETLMVAFGLQRGGGAPAGHHPIAVGFLGVFRAQVVFRDVRE